MDVIKYFLFKNLTLFFLLMVQLSIANDLDSLSTRLKLEWVSSTDTNSASGHLSTLTYQGNWADIDYDDTARTNWDPKRHVERLKIMAAAFNNASHPYYQDPSMLTGILRGIDYWYTENPTSDNWWFNEIGKQMSLGPMGILMKKNLSNGQLTNMINDFDTVPSMTGQNKVWISQNVIYRGILENNAAIIQAGSTGMQETIVISSEEGIQVDASFHQHGPQMTSGSYGASSILDLSFWMQMTNNLAFAFPEEKIDIFTRLMLEGTQWMTRRAYWDISVAGRTISRMNKLRAARTLSGACERMMSVNIASESEFEAYRDHLLNANDSALVGNKHFWRSDYMAHRRESYMTSIKMFSTRVETTEEINNENLQGYYLPAGANFIYLNGDEYFNIFPIWDWGRIPGTTSPHKDPAPVPSNNGELGKTSFVGGASDGNYGVAAFDLDWDGVTGKKSWFFFGDEYVALGADISGSGSEAINTTINQTLKSGDICVAYGAGDCGINTGVETVLSNPSWVHHNSVGYVFPSGAEVNMSGKVQTGSWKEIRDASPGVPISGEVFSLWFDHGVNPVGQDYEYIVLPAAPRSETKAYVADNPIEIVANSNSVQSVHHTVENIVGVAFYQSGSVTVNAGLSIGVNVPCVVIYDYSSAPATITVSNPLNTAIDVSVTVNGTVTDVILPSGTMAGSSITVPETPTAETDPDGNEPEPDGDVKEIETGHISFYPNPVKNVINFPHIASEVEKCVKGVEIYSIDGKLILSQKFRDGQCPNELDVSILDSGLYVLITIENNVVNKAKFIKE